jgi:diadenosine tetraphosphate (Ap4A) HIT family hydrolase
MHVHFHIIPKFGSEGLGVHWPARKLTESTARELIDKMRQALEA